MHLLGVDWSRWKWSQLWEVENFHWQLGVTPFSNLQVPLFVSTVYLVSLFGLQRWMKDRNPYVLKLPTFVHNVILTVLASSMFAGSAYGAYQKYQTQGFWAGLVCEQDRNPMKGPLFFWCYVFYLSKFHELLDSYLLVLKKKPLIFLHVFHHLVMPYVCWAGLEGKWCMALWTSCFWNSAVHILMYYYYTIASLGYSVWWKKYLTAFQICQFLTGIFYTGIYFYYYFESVQWSSDGYASALTVNQGCTGDLRAIFFMFSVNCSFLFLFAKFFFDSYLSPTHNAKSSDKTNGVSHSNGHSNGYHSKTPATREAAKIDKFD